MKQATLAELLQEAPGYFEQVSNGYRTWGKVEVLQIALRSEDYTYLCTPKASPGALLQPEAYEVKPIGDGSVFGRVFSNRKGVDVILITRQDFGSQVTETIPPILDDQAQLLGVTVRIARSLEDAPNALSGRFAAILPEGESICIGATLEDAYVAAQLLEKTSRAFVEGKYLGGAKSINKIEAWLMQKFYQWKYAKEASKNIRK